MTTTATALGTIERSKLTGEYTLDPTHSRIGFVARHAVVTKVRGQFRDFEGTLILNGDDPARSGAQVTIQATSIDTGQADRDAHLRSNDFFDMDEFPEITFSATAIVPDSETEYKVTGDLTMRGVTKPVTVDIEFLGATIDPFGNERVGFEGSVRVNRKDWGINWNAALEAGGMLVSEKVTLEFEIAAIKAN